MIRSKASMTDPIAIKSPFPTVPDEYYRRILELISELERSHGIKILYAIENGSRANGTWHDKSDCDIRFIFKYVTKSMNTSFGRRLLKKTETIEGFSEDRILDWQGWGIEKAVEAISHSNPSILEFLYSPICYSSVDNFHKDCVQIVKRMHNTKSLYYHYLNMAKRNWKEHIIDSDGMTKINVLYKKYMYILRPILMFIYIKSPSYDVVKNDKPIINDFDELLDTVMALYRINDSVIVHKDDESKTKVQNPYVIDSKVLQDISLVVHIKKTDKTYEGPGLNNLNQWIENIFVTEENAREEHKEDKKEIVVFQAINGAKCKLDREIEKINALSTKNTHISRNDYISLFNHYLLFTWLVQHPDKHTGNAPTNIIELLDQITFQDHHNQMVQWIREIITKTDEFEDRRIDYEKKQEIRKNIIINALRQTKDSLGMIDVDVTSVADIETMIDIYEKTGKLVTVEQENQDNIIELFFKNHISLLWLLKNQKMLSGYDILNDKDTHQIIPKKILETVRQKINELRPKYVCPVNLVYHKMIQDDVKNNEEYVKNAATRYAKQKDTSKRQMYKNAMVEIDPKEFIELLDNYC